MCSTSPTRFRYNERVEKVISKFTKRCHKPVLAVTTLPLKTPQEIHEFGIKHNRYAFCRVALVGAKAISLAVQSCSEWHGFLLRIRQSTLPSFAFSQFRECAFYALIMHYQMNRHVKCILDGCSMLSGMLFQLNWNIVPTYLEHCSILTVTRLEPKKLTTRACGMGNERWRLEVRRVNKVR